ncbi:MAG: hypothetical protein U1F43_23420 [Myxococcota bacterium]
MSTAPRLLPLLLVPSLTALCLAACGSDGAATGDDTRATGDADAPDAPDAPDATGAEDSATPVDSATAPDGTDVAAPEVDVPNPQADAYQAVWSERLRTDPATDGHVLGLRYIAGQGGGGTTTPSTALALLEVSGTASLSGGDGAESALPGEGHRLIVATLAPDTGAVVSSAVVALPAGASVARVGKAGAGFAATVHEAAGDHVVVGQAIGTDVRVTTLALAGGSVRMPSQGDLRFATSSGVTTAMAVELACDAAATLAVSSGESTLSFDVPAGGGIAFVQLAAPSADAALPSEGTAVVVVPGLAPSDAAETRSGPVVAASVGVATTLGTTALVAGEKALVIGALDEQGALAAFALWHAAADGGSVDVIQLAGGQGGGLVLAGRGEGDLHFGPDELTSATPRDFIAALGSAGSLLYEAPECDRILAVSVSNQYRILKVSCDVDGDGPGLVLTSLTTDFGGNLQDPIDQLLLELPTATAPAVLAGIVSFTVTDGRASGALVDFGRGPRLVLVRGDGQAYDSGVPPALVRSGPSTDPLFFTTLRFGGGGGATNPNTNAVLFAVPAADGTVIGRARIVLLTIIQ